ncbi:MAG TPA: glycosyltransferase [Polyangia bacterium]|jgi:UDP:flavonoid glycosyltransferase YjiC (YdhE family)|nr:glycosyltransferase [Polyangia bacterium]
MRIAVTTWGSEGDVRPFIALTRRLRQAGQDAWLAAPRMHIERAAQAGVPLRTIGRDLRIEDLRDVMTRVMRERNPLRQAGMIFGAIVDEMLAALPDVLAATRDAELIVHHQIDVTGFAAAEIHKVPRVSCHLFHGGLRSSAATPDGRNFGSLGNRLVTRFFRFLMGHFADGHFNRVLVAAGLPPRPRLWVSICESPLLNLLAVSPSLVPTDPLWPEQRVTQTGYWFLDVSDFAPPPDLADFVTQGPAPVAVTFGSMTGPDARLQTEAIVGALTRLGRRAVLQAGWNQLGETDLPSHILRVDYVPHDWLFPRAACVVHHGGAGTTAAVVRAGVPHVIVHHLGDQPAWAKLLELRGLAAKPLPHQKLKATSLAERIAAVVDDADMHARARAMGERVRAEDGLGAAVAAIERVMNAEASGVAGAAQSPA